MLLPSFPLDLWTQNILEGLANSIGKFIRIDRDSLHGMNKTMARVMVELNISEGIPTEIEVIWGDKVF